MATKDEKPGSRPSPGRNLLPNEIDSVAGAYPPPRAPSSSGGETPSPGGQTPGTVLPQAEAAGVAGAYPPPRDASVGSGQLPEPGLNLEIETLGTAAAGATSPTIKLKINASLDEAD